MEAAVGSDDRGLRRRLTGSEASDGPDSEQSAPSKSGPALPANATVQATTTTTTPAFTTTAPAFGKSSPSSWVSYVADADAFFFNLPHTDNWSEYGELRTVWNRLRLLETPYLGNTSVEVDLRDVTFAVSNGAQSSGHHLADMPWGIAADCSDDESGFQINLLGTPFNYRSPSMEAQGNDAHGGVNCTQDAQLCQAQCGGWCGYCGLGHPATTTRVTLDVVDQALFDAGIVALTTSTVTTTSSTFTNTTSTATSTVTEGRRVELEEGGQLASVLGTLVAFTGTLMVMIVLGALIWKKLKARLGYGRFDDERTSPVPPNTMGFRSSNRSAS